MIIEANLAAAKSTKPHEYTLRFVFGGTVTAAAGYIAMRYGPVIGGLFLAFPAIFPASVSLVASHENKRKREIGYDGTMRGRAAASLEAAGTFLGALALLAFAYILHRFLPANNSALTLISACLAWLVLATLLWFSAKYRPRFSTQRRP
jgi:Protein of unknown function (DUF3147)